MDTRGASDEHNESDRRDFRDLRSAFAAPTLRLSTEHYRTIVAHCYDGLPDEACGVLTGPFERGEPTGVVSEARPCRNADASARTFTVDSRDLLAAMRAAETAGEEIIAVWHSHTHTDAYPSPTDVGQAADPTWLYVIVSLKHEDPALRAYRIRGEEIAEIGVVLDDVPPAVTPPP